MNRREFHLSFTNNKIGLDIEFQNLDHRWMEKFKLNVKLELVMYSKYTSDSLYTLCQVYQWFYISCLKHTQVIREKS